MSASPAPATVSLPPRAWKRRAAKRESIKAPPAADITVRLLLAAEIQFRAGTPMAECAEKLLESLSEQLRSERLSAETIPAPACDGDALLSHDMGCECPECFPVEDDGDEHPLFVSEADQVLSNPRGYLGVPSALGGW